MIYGLELNVGVECERFFIKIDVMLGGDSGFCFIIFVCRWYLIDCSKFCLVVLMSL